MDLFEEVVDAVTSLPFVCGVVKDDDMKIVGFVCPRATENKVLLEPLVSKGLLSLPENGYSEGNSRKFPLQIKEKGREFWRALLVLRTGGYTTIAISSDKERL